MISLRDGFVAAVMCSALAVAGCSPQSPTPAPAAAKAQADAATANTNLETYRQLLRINNDEMAVTMGKDIVSRFPHSEAAEEVQQTLPAIEARYKDNSEKARLAAMWWYQVAPMAGGTQSTATIRNSQPGTAGPVQLVLRRHTQWGQSAFLYGSGHGFVCRGTFAPSTGEPALMLRDDKGFIAMLRKSHKINIDVTLVDGEKKQTLVYEVGGFDPAKWSPLNTQKAR